MKFSPSTEEQKEMFRRMVLTRRLEETLGDLVKEGKTRGPLHRCDGQEAVGVAACAALRSDDYVCTTHRGHHVYVGKGLDPRRIVAEIFGRVAQSGVLGIWSAQPARVATTPTNRPHHGMLSAV